MKQVITPWQRVRKLFMDIHLWLGLGSGLVVIVLCLSGTLYVYNAELVEMNSPHLYKTQSVPGSGRITPEVAIEKVKQVAKGKVISVSIPEDKARTYQVNVKEEGDKSRNGTTYYVDPYSGEIMGNSLKKSKMQEFMSSLFSLHRWLMFDKIETPIFSGISNRDLGRGITGTATILFTLGCISGLMIWFPKRIKNWKQGLKIKISGNWKRTNHDLHNSLAFYSLFLLLIMGLTGPQWSFQWYRTGMQKTLGTYKNPENKKEKLQFASTDTFSEPNSSPKLKLSDILSISDKELPFKGDYRISLAEEKENGINIIKMRTGFFAPAAGDKIELNKYNGALIKKEIFRNKPVNERIAGSIKALHVGTVYGGFSKLLYFTACLIASSLPVTGTLIWLNKLKKKKKKPAKKTRAFEPAAA